MGATTRRTWTDICKVPSSHSEDETNDKKKKLNKSKKTAAAKKAVAKGRIRKPKLKRPLKISGLDLLHSQTLFSTSDQAIGIRLPAAAGCIDEQLTNYAGTMTHEELDVPDPSTEPPYGLKILLDVYKTQFMNFLENMRSASFKENLHRQIENEREKNKRLLNRTGQLEKQIKVLVEDSVVLLKARMQELGINTSSQNDLLCKAKEIVGKHKELQIMANKIQTQVNTLEEEHNSILAIHVKKLAEKHSKQSMDFELASKDSHDLVLKEIENTFNQRKNLRNKISSLEAELAMIEKANEDRKQSAVNITTVDPQIKNNQVNVTVSVNAPKPNQGPVPSKASRKSREHRTKAHEWPEIPEIGKIEEKNPEILAQKILETGRQIEAGKFLTSNEKPRKVENVQNYTKKGQIPQQQQQQQHHHHQSQQLQSIMPIKNEMMQMGNPQKGSNKSVNISVAGQHQMHSLPKAGGSSKKVAESHKVVNFEDRLKSIITSALQGQDQIQGGQQQQQAPQLQKAPPQQQPQQQQQQAPSTNISPKKMSHQSTPYPYSVHPQQQQSTQMLTINTMSNSGNPSPQHHLQATISPNHASPMKSQRQVVPLPQMAPHLPPDHAREHAMAQHQQESTYAQLKRNEHMPNFAKVMNIIHHDSPKMYQRHPPSMPPTMIQQQQQHPQSQFMQREREGPILYQQRPIAEDKREFKTPDNVRSQELGRSSVGSIENEYINSGSNSSSNKSQTQRSSSSLSQPDYTQVSPAKLALRRHLSQEKLAQHQGPSIGPSSGQLTTKTIGDFINSEIEKTLEITPQSIINAVIHHNMPSNSRMHPDSIMDCSINQEREIEHHHPYATLKPTSSKPQQQQQQQPGPFMHYIDHHRQANVKMLPMSSKYVPSTSSQNVRKSAISTPPLRMHEDQMNYMSGSKSPERHQESSYKIDTKMFTSNIGMSMRKDEMKEKMPNVEHEPPLEGLAASLRQHVIASMKIKEESETEPKFPTYQMPYPHIIKKECKLMAFLSIN